MIRWLERLMRPGSERERYEEDVRVGQREKVKQYAEAQRQEIDERLAYLEATAETLRRGQDHDHSH